jgi:hypothetical protein
MSGLAIMKCRLAVHGLLVIGLVLSPSVVWARVVNITLKELVDRSDLIVLADVVKVEDGPADLKLGEEVVTRIKIATAQVLEVWKGNAGRQVRYLASRTWACDVSQAKVGERVVLFLAKPNDSPFRAISHSGRGRMPIRDVQGRLYATIRAEDVRLPKGFMTIPGPESKYDFIRSVDLSGLRWTVRTMGHADFLSAGSVCTFVLAGATWFSSSRRRLDRKVAPLNEIGSFDDMDLRDASYKTRLRVIAGIEFLVAALSAFAVLWSFS